MTTQFRYEYSVLQYAHDPSLCERINVGTVLYSRDARKLIFKIETHNKRIRTCFPSLKDTDFTVTRNLIERLLTQSAKGLAEHTLFSNSSDDLNCQKIVLNTFDDRDTSFHWQKGGTGKSRNLEEAFMSLHYDYVLSNLDRGDSAIRITDDDIWRQTSKELLLLPEAQKFEGEKEIQAKIAPVKFRQSYMNGKLNVVTAISLDSANKENMQNKAFMWNTNLRLVAEQNITPHLVVGEPSDDRLKRSFDPLFDMLRELETVKIYKSREVESLKDQISRDMRH